MPLGNNEDIEDELDTPVVDTEDNEDVADTPVQEEEKPNLPEISFIVEDGTGVSEANTYVDLDYALEYAVMKGYDSWTELTEIQQKIFLIRGTEYIDNYFMWKGRKAGPNQGLKFPRVELYDSDRFEIRGIPVAVKKACIEAAYLNSTSETTSLFSSKDENGEIKRQKVESLEVEYFENKKSNNFSSIDYTSIYDILNKLLKGLYRTGDESKSCCTRVIWSY